MKIERNFIIAIDPAWAKPYGVVIFENSEWFDDGLYTYKELDKLLEGYWNNYYVTIVIEEPYLGMNPNTLLKLGYAVGGIIMPASLFENVTVELIKPMHWKLYFGLSGKLSKGVRQQIKNQLCPKKFLQKPDIQDSYLIGRYYIEKHRIRG